MVVSTTSISITYQCRRFNLKLIYDLLELEYLRMPNVRGSTEECDGIELDSDGTIRSINTYSST